MPKFSPGVADTLLVQQTKALTRRSAYDYVRSRYGDPSVDPFLYVITNGMIAKVPLIRFDRRGFVVDSPYRLEPSAETLVGKT